MADATHPFFAEPRRLGREMNELYSQLKHFVKEGAANGNFTTYADRLQGHVVTDTGIVGVWATRGDNDRITEVTFFRVVDDAVDVDEERNVDWSYWDLLERARDWRRG